MYDSFRMGLFYFDWTWWVILPAILIALYAQIRVKSTYAKYARVMASSGQTALSVARRLLDEAGLSDIPVEVVPGELTDHYDPTKKVFRLSESVARSRSLAALGVAAHEAGHALQHAQAYLPLVFRNGIAPLVMFGQHLWYIILLAGVFLFYSYGGVALWLLDLGIFVMTGVVLFQVVTLPVEFNASRRALKLLVAGGMVTEEEVGVSKSVLDAAAFTYVAATLVAIMQLVRLLLIRRSRG